jgi:hypothetical protein
VVLKDTWIDSDLLREGGIVDSIRTAASGDIHDRRVAEEHFLTPVCHGDVWTEPGVLDDTANGLMRKLNIPTDDDSLFLLQRKITQKSGSASRSGPASRSDGPPTTSGVKSLDPPIYAPKIHYRVVLKEICTPIYKIKSLPDVMTVLSETVSGAFWYGTVHL